MIPRYNSGDTINLAVNVEKLIECTAIPATRFNVGVRPHLAILSEVFKAGGIEINDIPLSRSTLHRKKFKYVELEGDSEWISISNHLKGRRLILHFDTKLLEQITSGLNIIQKIERLAVSVSSPDDDTMEDHLLGVVQCPSSKGVDQAEQVHNLLEYYGCTEQIIGICCDTTASNTGGVNGAVQILKDILKLPILWIMCRRHIYEVHVSHYMAALTGEKTKGPRRALYVKLKNKWPEICEKVNEVKNLCKLDWQRDDLKIGSVLRTVAEEAKTFLTNATTDIVFSRNDYGIVCKLASFFLGVEVQDFKFHQPGACHEARFLADAIYILTLYMTKDISNILTEKEVLQLKDASLFIAICYVPWFLKSFLGFLAPYNDLKAIQTAYALRKVSKNIGNALLLSMGRHTWYLTPQLYVLSFGDKEVPSETKLRMLLALIEFEEPNEFQRCKPSNVQIGETTELPELISEQSYLLFKHFKISRASIKEWLNNSLNTIDVFNHPQLLDFIAWIKNISVVNDGAERNIKLIKDFLSATRDEDHLQNVLFVVKKSRKNLTKTMTKKELGNCSKS